MSKYVIIHGTFYEVSNDQLMHWKYIKREKKNGRWVYYYDQSELNALKSNVNNAKLQEDAARNGLIASRVNRDVNADIYAENGNASYTAKIVAQAAADANRYEKAYKNKSEYAKRVTKKYNSMAVKTFAARTISKGLVKVANFFSKLFSKKK